MAIQFTSANVMFKEVAKVGFSVLTGGGIALAGLLAWTGADDLQAIKDKFYDFETEAQMEIDSAVLEYSQVVVDANAEIGEYKQALEQANSNISQLITAYNNAETEHQTEVSNLQKEHQTELANKQAELEDLEKQLAENYVSVDEVNEVIAKANEQIGQANEDVENTKSDIEAFVQGSMVSNGTYLQNKLNSVEEELDVEEGKPTVEDISSIVPSKQE